jgi:membrane protein YqaA with SNARE-associated domain
MAIFSNLYNKILVWSKHQHAVYYLALVAFSEALIFPIPPDVMLVSMGLAKPQRAWAYAGITLIFSILGGTLGYLIGVFCFDIVHPYIHSWGYESTYIIVHDWFKLWGPWAIIGASFMPIPFKILAITAGAVKMPFYSFILAAFLGRGARFFLVSGSMFLYGEKVAVVLNRYIDKIGMAILIIPFVAYLIYALLY